MRRVTNGPLTTAAMALALIAASWSAHASAQAQPVQRPREIATPEERPLALELEAWLATAPGDSQATLVKLDGLLARLHWPTRLRGLVQAMRADSLVHLRRIEEAREAIEESARLLPGHGPVLMLAARLEGYSDRAVQAVDYLMRASEIDPAAVQRIDDYELNNIVLRLRGEEGEGRLARLAERLFAIGWRGESLTLRSTLATAVIKARVEAGDLVGARAMLPHLLSPVDARLLLMQHRSRSFWNDVEKWTGPRQSRLWRIYLDELRTRWRASRDPDDALPYIRALAAANHDRTIIREALPLFSELDARRHYRLIWVAPPLGSAFAREGRWQEGEEMYRRALAVWPAGSDANVLNLTANFAGFRLLRGDAGAAANELGRVLEDAARWGPVVSVEALSDMHYFRACALEEDGRGEQAVTSVAFVLGPPPRPVLAAKLHLCFGRHQAARDVLLAALEEEELREDVLAFMQPQGTPQPPSEHARMMRARSDALRADPHLLAALSEHGRILPEPISAGAPPEKPGD